MSTKLSRRQFIGASAGAAAAVSLGGVAATYAGAAGGRPTIPPGLLGVQHFSVRDATARLSIASSQRLGLAPAWASSEARTTRRTRPTWARSCRSRAGTPRCSSSWRPPASGASSSSSRRRTS